MLRWFLERHFAPLQYEYLWADGVKVVKPIRLTAPEYINALCDWIESQVRLFCSASCTYKPSLSMPQAAAIAHAL